MKNNSLFLSPFVAVGAGFAAAVILLAFISPNPFSAVVRFFFAPFSSVYYLGSWLNVAGLLTFAALGAVFALQSGNLNLGGEGQIYLSGFVTAIILNALTDFYPPFALLCAFFAALLCAGFAAMLSGVLKMVRGISEVLSSFLVSAAIIPLVDFAVSGKFRDKSGNLLATPLINESLRFEAILPPSSLNLSFLAAVFLCIFAVWFFARTRAGYIYRMCGVAPEFAAFSGFSPKKISVRGMFASGSLHGLTGFFAVTGTYFTCYGGFYAGLGWNALTVALIARSNPAAVFPAALVMAFLLTASGSSAVLNSLTFDVCDIISAVMLFFISAQFLISRRKKKTDVYKETGEGKNVF